MKKEEQKLCREHQVPFLTCDKTMAYLVNKNWFRRTKLMKKILKDLTKEEKRRMKNGTMPVRHFHYRTWCEDRFISWL